MYPEKVLFKVQVYRGVLRKGMNCYYFCKKPTCETVAWFFFSSRVCGERKTGFIILQWMGWSRGFSPCVLLQKHVSNSLKYVTIQLNIILNHRNFNVLVVFIKIQADSLSSQASCQYKT